MEKKGASFLFSHHGDAVGELSILNAVKKSDRPNEEKQRILADMKEQGKKYGFTFREYMLYDFEHKTSEEKYAFVSDYEHVNVVHQLNPESVFDILCDKSKTYEKFSDYFKRDVDLIRAGNQASFLSFIKNHNGFAIKSLDDYGGFGVDIIKNTASSDPLQLAQRLMAKFPGDFLVEGLLTNIPALSDFHPASLNTIRIPTVRYNDRVEVLHPFIRIGQGGKFIDNASSGNGIMGAVDPVTGEIFAARDEAGAFFEKHPDTGKQITGFRIPGWDEASALAKELACKLEGQRYCGWDIAITPNGCAMIEGNPDGMFVWQIPEMSGFRPEMNDIFNELGIQYQAHHSTL